MNGGLFEEHLEEIERAITLVCRQLRLHNRDAEDFASDARVELLRDDCEILRRHEGRSSLTTYLAVVLRRLFVDQKRANGRWQASAEAMRRGEAAMMIERLVVLEQMPAPDAIAVTAAQHPEKSIRELEEIAVSLPARAPRVRMTALGEGDDDRFAARGRADERVELAEVDRTCTRASAAVSAAFAAMSAEDRVILRLRFGKEVSLADIARTLGLPQRPLYRRVEALLASLRRALESAGVRAGDVADLIDAAAGDRLDFTLDDGKSGEIAPTLQKEKTR